MNLVPLESGQLIGILIAEQVVADDEETYALALNVDWNTREFAISRSKDFASFMTPEQVPDGDITPLIRSEVVPQGVKTAVLAQSAEFAADADRATLTVLAQYAIEKGERVAVAELTRWALARVDAQLIVKLAEKQLPEIASAELVSLLEAVGGEYAEVSSRNGKRPRLANTESNLALVERLEQLEIASSHEVSTNSIAVNMRKAP